MNIETLRIFCDVVQHQSFSRGAKINDVSQSAATQSVHRVEEHFGVQLVDRSQAAVRPDSRRPGLLRRLPRGPGTLRLGRGPGPLAADGDQRPGARGGDLFGRPARHEPLHAGLHAAAIPRPRCGWSTSGPNKVYDAVLNAEVDLGIMSYPAASPDLNVIPLRSERMVVVCQPGHRAGHARRRSRPSTSRARISSAFDRDLSIRKEIDRYLRQRSVDIRDRDGVRQHRDDQAGGGDRRGREHPARADRPRRRAAAARWRRSG